jgi:hypothetical protein
VVAQIAAPAKNGLGTDAASNKMDIGYLSGDKAAAAWH